MSFKNAIPKKHSINPSTPILIVFFFPSLVPTIPAGIANTKNERDINVNENEAALVSSPR